MPCENPKSILLQGSPWTLISRLVSTCHGIQLSVYMDLYVKNKYSEYYCYGCALVTLQYRSELQRTTTHGIRKIREDCSVSRPFLTI